MNRFVIYVSLMMIFAAALPAAGCRAGGSTARPAGHGRDDPVRAVRCIYDQKPWLNLDKAGDRDPEGIHFRVFLDTGGNQGVLRDGSLRIEMYQIDRVTRGEIQRTLVSDWDYPTSAFQPVKSKILGMGYHLRLRWASKDVAGHEVELIVHYRAPDGSAIRSGTKRIRVPAYRM